MLQKINEAYIKSYISLKSFVSDFKKEEEGMEVVQTIMITLVGVLAVGILWTLLEPYINDLWERIIEESDI